MIDWNLTAIIPMYPSERFPHFSVEIESTIEVNAGERSATKIVKFEADAKDPENRQFSFDDWPQAVEAARKLTEGSYAIRSDEDGLIGFCGSYVVVLAAEVTQ